MLLVFDTAYRLCLLLAAATAAAQMRHSVEPTFNAITSCETLCLYIADREAVKEARVLVKSRHIKIHTFKKKKLTVQAR